MAHLPIPERKETGKHAVVGLHCKVLEKRTARKEIGTQSIPMSENTYYVLPTFRLMFCFHVVVDRCDLIAKGKKSAQHTKGLHRPPIEK